ncbi:MAG TPA: hypothetical protein VIC56_01760 [Gemmatimonadota bacterium]|jgi:hypothetical protein
MYLAEGPAGEVSVRLRAIARSGMGWYPRKTIAFHPDQLRALEILVKRARGLLAARDAPAGPADDPQVIPLPYLGCPAVAE